MPGSGPDRTGRPKVLVGIPSYRRPEGLRRLLRSLGGQRGVEDLQVEIFVADNDAARQEASALCRELAPDFRWPLRWAVVEEPGISAARNAILDQARTAGAEFVAMIDDDEVASPLWLSELLTTQANTGSGIVGGPVLPQFEVEPSAEILHSKAFWWFQGRPEGLTEIVHGAGNCLISAAMLAEHGWPQFDPVFGLTGGEDLEWFLRLKKLGAAFAWSVKATANEHTPLHRMKWNWILSRSYRFGVDDVRIARAHQGSLNLARTIIEAGAVLLTIPVTALACLVPKWRLRMIRRWARGIGRVAATLGYHYQEYGRASTAPESLSRTSSEEPKSFDHFRQAD